MDNTNNSGAAVHKFEKAGLGIAPFRFVGMEQQDLCYGEAILNRAEYERTGIRVTTAPGGTCAYCGTYIVRMFNVRSSDGRVFHVGSECINKTDDKVIVEPAKRAARKQNTAKRHAREAAKVAELSALLADEAVRAKLAAIEIKAGRTLLSSAEWFLANAGNAGKVKMAKQVLAALAA